MHAPQRVVVTGLGAVTPLGLNCQETWSGLRGGKSGVRHVQTFDPGDMPVTYGGEVDDLEMERYLRRPSPRDKSVQMAMLAAAEALGQAGLIDVEQNCRVEFPIGTIVGSGLGPWRESEATVLNFAESWKRVRPTSVPKFMFNSAASNISIYFGLRGCHHVIAAACSSGPDAIGQAYHLVKFGQERAVLCGGTDCTIFPAMFGAWMNLRVLAKHEDPQKASRPFDKHRSGLVLGDAAAMLVLESLESARQRNAEILCELGGFGAASDAHHITAPHTPGQVMALRRCLADAAVEPDQVNYINAHGTGTQMNDQVEANTIREVFGARGESLPISSTKSMVGHSLGAAGAVELVSCVRSIQDNFVAPTLNCDEPDPEIGLDYVPNVGRPHRTDIAVSQSFAFGGSNAVLLVKRFR